jgi:hypothetical protein
VNRHRLWGNGRTVAHSRIAASLRQQTSSVTKTDQQLSFGTSMSFVGAQPNDESGPDEVFAEQCS